MCMKSTRHCLPLTRAWSEHKDKEMSLSMRPLHKRKSLYYGCKVRNRAAIIFWEDKHLLEKGQKVRQGRWNASLCDTAFERLQLRPLTKTLSWICYTATVPSKIQTGEKIDLWWKKDISLFPFLQSHCIFFCPTCCISLWKDLFWMFFISPHSNLWNTHIGARFWFTPSLSSYSSPSINCFGGKR